MSVCERCGQTGHLSKDCYQQPTCNNCGVRGHVYKTCPNNKCDICSRTGHLTRDCYRAPGALKCYECGGVGHNSRNCTVKAKQPHRFKKVDREFVDKSREQRQFYLERARVLSLEEQREKKALAKVKLKGIEQSEPSKKPRIDKLLGHIKVVRNSEESVRLEEEGPQKDDPTPATGEGGVGDPKNGEVGSGLQMLAGYTSDDADDAE